MEQSRISLFIEKISEKKLGDEKAGNGLKIAFRKIIFHFFLQKLYLYSKK